MSLNNAFLPGTSKAELDTPSFVIDLDLMDENIKKMAAYFSERPVNVRPHVKHHKTPAIAHKQIAAGAIGVCCQKLGEAEVMVAAGIKDLLITYPMLGKIKLSRLMALCRQANVMVITDDVHNVTELSEAAVGFDGQLGVLLDIDVGQHRTGVAPGVASLDLAKAVSRAKGLNLIGVSGYAGHIQSIPDSEERAVRDQECLELLMDSVEKIRSEGIPIEIVSGGGTGTYKFTGNHSGMTEVQPGSYVFMDAQYRRAVTEFEVSGTILTTVISRPSRERAILDAGMKTISTDQWPPIVASVDGIEVVGASDEHLSIVLNSSDAQQLRNGDKIEIIPGHNDTTVNLHSHLFGLRNNELEVVWEVSARGKIR